MFLEHLMLKRTKSRVDVYMHDLKTFSGKQIYDLEDKDVLEYLIFKDTNESETNLHTLPCMSKCGKYFNKRLP